MKVKPKIRKMKDCFKEKKTNLDRLSFLIIP